MSRWQYYVLKLIPNEDGDFEWNDHQFFGKSLEEILDQLGADGWELVSATAQAFSIDGERAGVTTEMEYILKRPVA